MWWSIFSQVSLQVVDLLWMEHLVDMDHLRRSVKLRGYAQRDVMVEYKREGSESFEALVVKMYTNIAERLLRMENVEVSQVEKPKVIDRSQIDYHHGELESGVSEEAARVGAKRYVDASGRELKVEKVLSSKEKVGRNDLCPCGSGKKFKNCHGK